MNDERLPPSGSLLQSSVTSEGPLQFCPPYLAGVRIDLLPTHVPGPHGFEQSLKSNSVHTQSTANTKLLHFKPALLQFAQEYHEQAWCNKKFPHYSHPFTWAWVIVADFCHFRGPITVLPSILGWCLEGSFSYTYSTTTCIRTIRVIKLRPHAIHWNDIILLTEKPASLHFSL